MFLLVDDQDFLNQGPCRLLSFPFFAPFPQNRTCQIFTVCVYVENNNKKKMAQHKTMASVFMQQRSEQVISKKKRFLLLFLGWVAFRILVCAKMGEWIAPAFHSRSQGLEGVFGLSGVGDFKREGEI